MSDQPSIDTMAPRAAYEEGYRNGESNIGADIAFLLDEFDIEYEDHPITAVRREIARLRAALQRQTAAPVAEDGRSVDP